jgi:hypothetical protein
MASMADMTSVLSCPHSPYPPSPFNLQDLPFSDSDRLSQLEATCSKLQAH